MAEAKQCAHARTALIAKDADAEYIECLDCGAILETSELAESKPAPSLETPKHSSDQSLADA